jgi:hypothetical protein
LSYIIGYYQEVVMKFVNLCGYTASFSIFGDSWEPIPVSEYYAVVGSARTVWVRYSSEINPDGTRRMTLSGMREFPGSEKDTVYLVTPEVARALAARGRYRDIIGIKAPVVEEAEATII